MAEHPPAIPSEGVPLDQARGMDRGPRIDPERYHALTQNIPSCDTGASGWQEHRRHLLGGS
jgi:hypothetical protein